MVMRQKCPRERWLAYHQDGHGWQPRMGSWPTVFGVELHNMLSERVLGKSPRSVSGEFVASLHQYGERFAPEHRAHILHEQTTLLHLLVEGWMRYVWPQWSKEYELVSSEQETVVAFPADDYMDTGGCPGKTLEVPIRLDVLARPIGGDPNQLTVWDWKTTSQSGKDWQQKLENSLQSALYVGAVQQMYKSTEMYCTGIGYWGLVKGRSEVDTNPQSAFAGCLIQQGSFLYAWEKKDGSLTGKWANGTKRTYLGHRLAELTEPERWGMLERLHQMSDFFPTTLPWRPIDTTALIGQQIVAEGQWSMRADLIRTGVSSVSAYVEQHLDNCYKYGRQHPCAFVAVCHGGVDPSEDSQYEPRVHHHTQDKEL